MSYSRQKKFITNNTKYEKENKVQNILNMGREKKYIQKIQNMNKVHKYVLYELRRKQKINA